LLDLNQRSHFISLCSLSLSSGDIIPRNDIEIAYSCLVIFIGAVTFGYIISNVSNIIQIEDDADTKIRDKSQSTRGEEG
jgi:hypothetical protein